MEFKAKKPKIYDKSASSSRMAAATTNGRLTVITDNMAMNLNLHNFFISFNKADSKLSNDTKKSFSYFIHRAFYRRKVPFDFLRFTLTFYWLPWQRHSVLVNSGKWNGHFLPSGYSKSLSVMNQQRIRKEVPAGSLTLQVCLHLHVHLLPFCLIAQLGCFALKFSALHPTYRVVLMALHIVSVLVQIARPFLGYTGNLGERIPALSGFWILTALLHLPAQLFLGLNPDILPLPFERYTILLDTTFSGIELFSSTTLIRQLAHRQMERLRRVLAAQQQLEEPKNPQETGPAGSHQ